MRKMVIIRMLKAVDHQVVGDDGNVYGPFEAGKNYMVPEMLAKALAHWGYAEVI